jgi:hypothetical protein
MRRCSKSTSSSFCSYTTRDIRECYNCGDVGHIVHDCPKPFKSNRERGRGGTRAAPRGARGRGGKGSYMANLAGAKEEISKSNGVLSLELEESKERQGEGGCKDQDQETHYGDFINFAYMNEGNYANTYAPSKIS